MRRHSVRRRITAIALAVVALLLTATVGLAQSSAGYDLACRGALTSGGGFQATDVYGVLGAVGRSPAGESTSPNYGIHGGYVQPGSFTTAATADAAAPKADPGQRNLLPLIGRVVRIVRGGC